MTQGSLQHWNEYAPSHHETWGKLYQRQKANLEGKASALYLDCLRAMEDSLTCDHVPRISAMEAQLKASTGWSLTVVPGLIPV